MFYRSVGCEGTRHVPKKVSAATFSPNSRFAFIADKYGDVYTVPVPSTSGDRSREPLLSPSTDACQAGAPGLSTVAVQQGNAGDGHDSSSAVEETKGANGHVRERNGRSIGSVEGKEGGRMELLLGHFCSIVTSLDVSRDGRYIASTDRDNKVRINIVPQDPMQASSQQPPAPQYSPPNTNALVGLRLGWLIGVGRSGEVSCELDTRFLILVRCKS